MINVIGAGLVTADIIQLCDSEFRPLSISPIYACGGTVCNILAYLGAFGWNCTLLGGVGSDSLAEVVKIDLANFGVNTEAIQNRAGAITRRIAHLIVHRGPNSGQHKFAVDCYSCHRGFPPFDPPGIEEFLPILKQRDLARTILLVDRANKLTLELANQVSRAGGLVIFEPGYLSRRVDVVNELFKVVDVLKYSGDLLWNRRRFKDMIPSFHPRLKLTIETRGQRGVQFIRGNKTVKLTTTHITEIIDSAGAGDAFMAGFLTGIGEENLFAVDELSDASIEDAVERGQSLGSLACLFLSSKGVLYMRDIQQIEHAVKFTKEKLQPPNDFHSRELPKGIQVAENCSTSACQICRIPEDTNG